MTNTFTDRQTALIAQLPAMPILLSAYESMQLSGDMAAPFLQEANFFWLTGIDEPGWKLLLLNKKQRYIVAPVLSDTYAIFNGGLSLEKAAEMSGAHAISYSEYRALYRKFIEGAEKVGSIDTVGQYKYEDFTLNPGPKLLYSKIKRSAVEIIDVLPVLKKLRAIKSTSEVMTIEEAVAHTVDAFNEVKGSIRTFISESEVNATFSYLFTKRGLEHGYEPIVASSKNALTLHYNKNNSALPKNGLILLDVGARYEGYSADITRTYAIGTPSNREVAVHAAVEKAHFAIIDLIKPGVLLKDYQDASDEIMKEALRGLGLLNAPEDYRKYFPHAISHGLGIDVHESLGGYKEFQPGMVLTVEPGIYIREEGIGVRIEDDILVTETGNKNLSGHLPTSL